MVQMALELVVSKLLIFPIWLLFVSFHFILFSFTSVLILAAYC